MYKVKAKIARVPDSVCWTCSQLWEGVCRAYCLPHSDEEEVHRTKDPNPVCVKLLSGSIIGLRADGNAQATICYGSALFSLLNPRLDLRKHSPDGFEWGYNGSGPAQFSLAILAYVTKDDAYACTFYQDFKDDVIARQRGEAITLPIKDVLQWVQRHPVEAKQDFYDYAKGASAR